MAEEEKSPIGVALAGGGLQGFSHIGALKALEELGVKVEYISGTSSGSMMASLYAMQYSLEEIEKMCENVYKKILKIRKRTLLKIVLNLLLHKETRIEGLIQGEKVANFINKAANAKNMNMIDDFKKIKIAIATVDTKTMKECIFLSETVTEKEKTINYISNINIGKAVQSSIAFPGIFTASNYNEYNFIDGGTVNNLPVKVLKDMGAKKIISLSFDLNKYTPSKSIEGVVMRALDIFSLNSVRAGQKEANVAVEIYNQDTGLVNIKDLSKTIQNGYDAVMEKKEEILELIKNT